MLAKERQLKIMEMLNISGAVTTSNLVEIFGVSVESIRRDLLLLEQNGRISRVHGGAVKKDSMASFVKFQERNMAFSAQKRELSEKALRFISEGDIIAIDSGSTAIYFAEAAAKRFSRLQVITHSVEVFKILSDLEGFSVILCGGHYLRDERSFYGLLTINMLESLHFQKAFIFPDAVSLEYGISNFIQELCEVQKKMAHSSDYVYVLANSDKFEKKALIKLDDMKSDYIYITDSGLTEELKKLYKENNIEIYN